MGNNSLDDNGIKLYGLLNNNHEKGNLSKDSLFRDNPGDIYIKKSSGKENSWEKGPGK